LWLTIPRSSLIIKRHNFGFKFIFGFTLLTEQVYVYYYLFSKIFTLASSSCIDLINSGTILL